MGNLFIFCRFHSHPHQKLQEVVFMPFYFIITGGGGGNHTLALGLACLVVKTVLHYQVCSTLKWLYKDVSNSLL